MGISLNLGNESKSCGRAQSFATLLATVLKCLCCLSQILMEISLGKIWLKRESVQINSKYFFSYGQEKENLKGLFSFQVTLYFICICAADDCKGIL